MLNGSGLSTPSEEINLASTKETRMAPFEVAAIQDNADSLQDTPHNPSLDLDL